ncbi:hypothetical protein [Phytoactinopolyspora halophila]|uniref:hypothetical protein n=1 Tax=Phytoactinopolyspora halophila TaxID=1981511 RepID=UPI000F4EFD4B|nr:hypothetical protein [Phytoactinopolyspora halophila]
MRTLSRAGAEQRRALADMLEVAGELVTVEVIPILPDEIQKRVDRSRRFRRYAVLAQRRASREWRLAARELYASGMSMRDVATVLGVSHQRISQLVAP